MFALPSWIDAVLITLLVAFALLGVELAGWTIRRNRWHAANPMPARNLTPVPRVQSVRPPRHPAHHRMLGSPVLIDGGSRP